MKYFFDTEFMEGPQEKRFLGFKIGETKPTIDLISIGIVAEDGREYYAISKDFNLKEAWNRFQIDQVSGDQRNIFPEGKKVYWLRENVLKPILCELYKKDVTTFDSEFGNYNNFIGYVDRKGHSYDLLKRLISKYGKTNKEIAQEVFEFCTQDTLTIEKAKFYNVQYKDIEFYAYYADYDWVVFCWLFGKMMDLPNGFPMYCKDLKQMMDEKAESFIGTDLTKFNINLNEFEAVKNGNFSSYVDAIKNHPNYPKQENEHSAIDDAIWNKKFYEFLKQL